MSLLADYFDASANRWKFLLVKPWELALKGTRAESAKFQSWRPSSTFKIESFLCHLSFSEQFLMSLASANCMWSVYSVATESAIEESSIRGSVSLMMKKSMAASAARTRFHLPLRINAVMGGYLKSSSHNQQWCLERIQETLARQEASFESGNASAQPDRVSINTLMAAHVKLKDKKNSSSSSSTNMDRAMELRCVLQEKYDIEPDATSCNILLHSWSKSGRPDAPEHVTELLDSMEREFVQNNYVPMKPDSYSYNAAIDCHIKCGRPDAPKRAEELLQQMKHMYRNHGGCPISTSVYNAGKNDEDMRRFLGPESASVIFLTFYFLLTISQQSSMRGHV